ncbi:hypothetical protein HFP57_11210 [Parasphingopyxis algicola]|uniref:hypothetical protein n=1 Tax=Parasphingopyxis algicola TaxID=2026624 RepID=UPI0015A44F52|nr:hypothetical protein [Parasphingopyxis algicola]QLC25529.1 hypothetical protein HFP57_11210 [Parasphingopyxis algicola]
MSALALLLALASPADEAIAAERAFAAAAQTEGQWTAFRAFAAERAFLFTPYPNYAREVLADAENPLVSVMWWPARSFVSCDGAMAVNIGPWVRPGPRHGYFITVWERQADGEWRWLLDDGADLEVPMAAGEAPIVRQADCESIPTGRRLAETIHDGPRPHGASPDRTLSWSWTPSGPGVLTIRFFNGDEMETVFTHETAPAR